MILESEKGPRQLQFLGRILIPTAPGLPLGLCGVYYDVWGLPLDPAATAIVASGRLILLGLCCASRHRRGGGCLHALRHDVAHLRGQ